MKSERKWAIGLVAAITIGIAFRLVWLEDVQYRGDEAWTFGEVRAFWQTGDLPIVGMTSSIGVPNAGLSVWVFIALSALVPIDTPLALTRAVQMVNIGAILLLAAFVLRGIERSEREPWLWSVALASVNPFAVLFSRSIWPPDTLPLLAVSMLVGWWHRHRWWGGFVWGVLGATLGQIQLVGFFFAASFVACTWWLDRRSLRWSAWLWGSILGSLPMLPWLAEYLLVQDSGHIGMKASELANLVPWFILAWLNTMLGVWHGYSLGDDYIAFLSFPSHTYAVAGLIGSVLAVSAAVALRLGHRLYASGTVAVAGIAESRSSTALALYAGLVVFGGVLTLATWNFLYMHYLVVAFPLPWVFLAWCVAAGCSDGARSVANGRRLLAALVLLQACVTLGFLAYLHQTSEIHGDYAPYRTYRPS